MKKLHTVLFVLGAAFLACLTWKIGIGELVREVGALGWGLIPLVLCEGAAEFIHTVGWRYCLSGPHRSLSMVLLFRIRMAGYAINYLTPMAALGGEVTKATLLAGKHRGPEAITGVLIGKLCFALAHLLFVVIGSIFILWRFPLPRPLWLGMLSSSALVAGGIVAFLLLQKRGKLGAMVRWLVARKLGGPRLRQAARGISEVDEALKMFHRERPRDLLVAVCWHLLGYSVGIVQTFFFFSLLHRGADWSMAAGAWFFGMWFDLLTFAVPMNLGTLEGSRVVALKAIGYDGLVGMTYGVTLRLAQLFWAVFGLAGYGWMASRAGNPPSPLSFPPPRCRRSGPGCLEP